jgi:hypothetical protein
MCQFEDSVHNSIRVIVAFECLSQQREPQSTDNFRLILTYMPYMVLK